MLAMVTPFINSTTTFLTKEMFFMLTTWPWPNLFVNHNRLIE
jgi:hypothetical protein